MMAYLKNLIRLAYTTLINADNNPNVSYAQVKYMGKAADAFTVYPYGLSAQAPLNSLNLLFQVNANEENLAAIPYNPKLRFLGLKEGEVVIGNGLTKNYIKFNADGSLDVVNDGTVTVTAPNIIFNGNVTINGDLTVSGMNTTTLGAGGPAIARIGDSVVTVVSGTPYTGTITTGGTNTSI